MSSWRFVAVHILFFVVVPRTFAVTDHSIAFEEEYSQRKARAVQSHAKLAGEQQRVDRTPGEAVIKHAPPQELSLRPIFTLCVAMYGGISMLWLFRSYGLAIVGKNFHVSLLCLTWCSMSVGMHVLNKTLAAKLMAPGLIATAQMIIAVVLVGGAYGRELLGASAKQLRFWLIVPVFFSAMLCSSFYTYEYISLSMLTVLRNLTPLVVLPIERVTMGAGQTPQLSLTIMVALVVMLVGAVVYGGGIKEVSMIGVGFAMMNLVLAASDRLIQRRLLTEECKGLPSTACTIINNLLGIVPTMGLVYMTGEASAATMSAHQDAWEDPKVLIILALSGVVGIGICYLGFECQRVISATSFFVLQNVSKVAVVTAGMTFFGDPITSLGMVGLSMSLGGSFLYSKAQMDMAELKKHQEAKGLVNDTEDTK